MAIISASRRTDIPAFFPEWFMERVREGFFYRINPFNTHQIKSFSLKSEDVDTIVFWTKNPGPLLRFLPELDRLGLKYYFQFSLNPYDRLFEPHIPPLVERIDTFRALADMIGPSRMIWRYDPIVLSNVTPIRYHLDQFARLAGNLHGATERVMFSFLDFYGKANKRLKAIEQEHGITFLDITGEEYKKERWGLLADMQKMATDSGMSLWSCAESEELDEIGIRHGHCIDGKLVQELFGTRGKFSKDKYQRRECGCAGSVDMGSYNTCSFQCIYCYANASPEIIATNLKKHHRCSPALIGEYPLANNHSQQTIKSFQDSLF